MLHVRVIFIHVGPRQPYFIISTFITSTCTTTDPYKIHVYEIIHVHVHMCIYHQTFTIHDKAIFRHRYMCIYITTNTVSYHITNDIHVNVHVEYPHTPCMF